MNKVCAAGTGSYLEEQAEKLGISIREEFGDLALDGKNPVRLGERCTVFMESDLVHHQQRGAAKEDLVAGLSYSIVQNYLNKVAEDRPIGNHIFYQGATAANRGIVAAFEKVCGKKINVPPHHDVTGAIGAALLAMRERDLGGLQLQGLRSGRPALRDHSFECQGCPNHCEIRQVKIEGEKPLFYGSRCEKYEVGRARSNGRPAGPDPGAGGLALRRRNRQQPRASAAPSAFPGPCSSRNSCPSSGPFSKTWASPWLFHKRPTRR